MKKLSLKILLTGFILACSLNANAKLQVVATTTSMGMLAKEVGGDLVSVKTLVPPDRDAHYLQAKPSMIMALRRADALISVGADLEVGWLPAAIQSSANPKLQNGEPGYFEAAQHIDLLDTDQVADRANGDVHPKGNPHFNLDPMRMAQLSQALADRFASLDEENGETFKANANQLHNKFTQLLSELKSHIKNAPGVVMMHKNALYLLEQLSVPTLGYMEPIPGIPPTAKHLKSLADDLNGKQGVIIHAPYHQASGPKTLANNLGWQRRVVPLDPKKDASFNDYRKLLLTWVNALNIDAAT